MKTFKNLIDIMDFFKDEEFCHNFLKDMFWGKNRENKSCPSCGSCNVNEYPSNFKKNRCYDCKCDFSIRKNTLFDDSKISLKKWFMVIFLANSNKKGVSSYFIARQVGVTQKTAWFMLHRIRNVSDRDGFHNPFDGITEIDEAYLGGSESNKHTNKKGKSEKTVVLGLVERNSKQVKATVVESNKTYDLQPTIYETVKEGSAIVTDSYAGYDVLNWNYKHETVKHCVGEYVKESSKVAFKIHTNTIEGFWSLVKRTINGTHHWISKKHTNRYLKEMEYRYNTKELADNQRFIQFLGQSFGKLTYKQLISA